MGSIKLTPVAAAAIVVAIIAVVLVGMLVLRGSSGPDAATNEHNSQVMSQMKQTGVTTGRSGTASPPGAGSMQMMNQSGQAGSPGATGSPTGGGQVGH